MLVDKTGRSGYIIDVAIYHNNNIERKYLGVIIISKNRVSADIVITR